MSAMQALDRLNASRTKADAADADRANYAAFLVKMRATGWTADDVAEYSASVRVLMGPDDAAALVLFPAGAYASAHRARQAARDFWRGAA